MAKFLDYHGLSKLVEKIKNTYVNKNEQYEANLKWGGKNFAGSYGPIDAAMVPQFGANRFAFGNPKGITVEYSNDGGNTWLDYGASDAQKLRLTTIGDAFTIGKVKSSTPSNDMLRITFDTTSNNGISCCTILNKFVIFISSSGSQGCYCTIQGAIYNTQNTFEDIATKVGIAGWSGYNVINTKSIKTSSGSNQPDRYSKIRFIFGCSNTNENENGLRIISIYAFGGFGLVTPSNMAKNSHLYTYDYEQNAIFPGYVKATRFIGNATTATKASQDGDGNTISSTYLKLIGGVMGGTITTIMDSKPAIDFRRNHNSYGATLNYDTAGNEALAVNLRNTSTSFMINSGVNGNTWTSSGKYGTVIPTIQVKGKHVSINEFIPDNTTPSYALGVNGVVKATSFDGSTFTGNAATASKLGTATVGSAATPIYLNGGTPTACTHNIESDVPPNAKFTDTWRPLGTGENDACAGNDSRLSNSRPASDVYTWAKAATKPSYFWDEITDKPSSFTPASHNHDDRYYTETEMNSKLGEKVDNTVNGCNALLSKLNTLTDLPIDDEYFIRQETAGSSTFGRVKFSTLWSYIKDKSDSIYQPTGSYAAAFHTHTKDKITDFPSSLKNPTSLTIQGNGSTMAAYDGSKEKTVNITKSSIGLENVDNTADADKIVKSAASADKVNGHTVNKDVPSNAVLTDENVYQVFDNATTSFLPLLLSPLTEDTKADKVHQTTNAKYNFAIGAVPSEGKIKATIFDGTTFTGKAATAGKADSADSATTASKLSKSTAGSTIKPVYFKDGIPTPIGYTIETSVPKNAVFTDTIYTLSQNHSDHAKISLTSVNGSDNITIDNVANAVTATKLSIETAGTNKKPVYFTDGVPYKCDDTLDVNITGKYSYGGVNSDFVYDVIDDGVNHYIKCKGTTIIRANETNLSKYAFIVNADTKGGFYIYDSSTAKGTTWGPTGIIFDVAPAGSLVASDGTFATAISDTDIKNAINAAIDWTQTL